MSERPVVVIYGPQGCGKTRLAEKLFATGEFTEVVDEWNGSDPVPPGALVVTHCAFTRTEPRPNIWPPADDATATQREVA